MNPIPPNFLSFARLRDAARSDGYEVEQFALRRVTFKKQYHVARPWVIRLTYKLCAHRGWINANLIPVAKSTPRKSAGLP